MSDAPAEPNLFDRTGQVAVVTGSSRGIGRAFALHGVRVVISSRKQEACEAVGDAINTRHGAGRAIAVAASISSKPALRALVDRTNERLGAIDLLVCNAASSSYYGPLAGISDEQFRKILDNILSNHWLIGMAAPAMIERRRGAIIVVSSAGGLLGSETIGTYTISKAADFQLLRNLAVEYGRHDVRINAIAPGVIRTDFARALWEDKRAEAALSRATPLRRIGEAGETAGAAVFLATRASPYVTGQMIVVDGGATISGALP